MLFLGSFPPRECGIATFTKDVVDSFDARFAARSDVIAIEEPGGELRVYPPSVVERLVQTDRTSYARTAAFINEHPSDALNIQHEFGLFGGDDGEWIVDLIDAVRKPVIVTLHTVLPEPSDHHFETVREICERAQAVVVLSNTGRDILIKRYGVTPEKIWLIHHGVPDVPFRETGSVKATLGLGRRTVISTFGLINRGKGLEYAIQAMREIVPRHPDALYLILGQTHPVVRRREGEEYRESLQAMVRDAGLDEHVLLIDRYLALDEIVSYLAATDIYLTPYLNPVQIVSGTLAYAVGSGKAIVSTRYLYAEELLAHGRGFLVDFRDAGGIASTINALLDDPGLRASTERRAYRFGRRMTWPHVADEYGRLFTALVPARPSAVLVPA
jgi:glycosyltransferase involved in cell wall biosynthesis